MERKKLRMAGLILAVLPVQTVSMKYGYDLRAETYADDPRFTFLRCVGRGHKVFTAYYKKLDENLMTQIVAFCDSWVE